MSCPTFTHMLVLPHLKVHNANAVSSSLTHGFPSITAFLGLMWALERKTRKLGLDLEFNAVGVVCHRYEEQTTAGGFVKSFRLTRNPVGRDGKTAAIVEEGRIHLDLTLLMAVNVENGSEEALQRDLQTVTELLQGMRIAGGTLLPSIRHHGLRHRPWVADLVSDERNDFGKLRVRLLPGSALVARDDLIDQRWHELKARNSSATRLDAWLSLSRINWHYEADGENGKGEWQHDRKDMGWIVPIPVGYGALGNLHAAGSVPNARDASTPFRFVESLYSVGEWISPHRLHSPLDLLWYADSQPDQGLYRCRNDYRAPETSN